MINNGSKWRKCDTGESVIRYKAAEALGQLKNESALIPLIDTMITFAKKAIENETNNLPDQFYSWNSLDDPKTIKFWVSYIVCAVLRYGEIGKKALEGKIEENKNDDLIDLLRDLKEVPGKWRYFIDYRWKTVVKSTIVEDIDGVCDICSCQLVNGKA